MKTIQKKSDIIPPSRMNFTLLNNMIEELRVVINKYTDQVSDMLNYQGETEIDFISDVLFSVAYAEGQDTAITGALSSFILKMKEIFNPPSVEEIKSTMSNIILLYGYTEHSKTLKTWVEIKQSIINTLNDQMLDTIIEKLSRIPELDMILQATFDLLLSSTSDVELSFYDIMNEENQYILEVRNTIKYIYDLIKLQVPEEVPQGTIVPSIIQNIFMKLWDVGKFNIQVGDNNSAEIEWDSASLAKEIASKNTFVPKRALIQFFDNILSKGNFSITKDASKNIAIKWNNVALENSFNRLLYTSPTMRQVKVIAKMTFPGYMNDINSLEKAISNVLEDNLYDPDEPLNMRDDLLASLKIKIHHHQMLKDKALITARSVIVHVIFYVSLDKNATEKEVLTALNTIFKDSSAYLPYLDTPALEIQIESSEDIDYAEMSSELPWRNFPGLKMSNTITPTPSPALPLEKRAKKKDYMWIRVRDQTRALWKPIGKDEDQKGVYHVLSYGKHHVKLLSNEIGLEKGLIFIMGLPSSSHLVSGGTFEQKDLRLIAIQAKYSDLALSNEYLEKFFMLRTAASSSNEFIALQGLIGKAFVERYGAAIISFLARETSRNLDQIEVIGNRKEFVLIFQNC